MADKTEHVYALHDFDAENPDEVSFKAGETLVVVEKDDMYGDGWWQGTNPRGETGLFPFSYTTFDMSQATLNAAAVRRNDAEVASATNGASGKIGVKAAMDDIDQTLKGMGAGEGAAAGAGAGVAGAGAVAIGSKAGASSSRKSLASQGTSAGDSDMDGDADDEYEQRAKARAALAVNAAKGNDEADEAERVEQARIKAQAMRIFEEEEEKHRQLLLKKEQERAAQSPEDVAAAESAAKPKEVPIPGVAMSDDSDSEDEEKNVATYEDVPSSVHAPLLGGASSGTIASSVPAPVQDSKEPVPGVASVTVDPPAAEEISTEDKERTPSAPSYHSAVENGAVAAGALAAGAAAAGIYHQQSQSTFEPKADASKGSADTSAPAPSIAVPPAAEPAAVNQTQAHAAAHSVDSNDATERTTTAPTSTASAETPKSQARQAPQSPESSVGASKPSVAGPGGDPHEWTVDQVVEWGRSKGWDEGAVVSKFAEHEISGDVLMEMDINILKEIDITTFGKRFQVANAIKELKKASQPADTSIASSGAGPTDGLPVSSSSNSMGLAPAFSPPTPQESSHDSHGKATGLALGAAGAVAGATGAAAGMKSYHGSARGSSSAGGEDRSPFLAQNDHAFMPQEGQQREPSLTNTGHSNQEGNTEQQDSFEDARQSFSSNKLPNEMQYSTFASQHAASGHKKRESGSSGPRSPGDRSSFFAGLSNRTRKSGSRIHSGQQVLSEDDSPTPGSAGSKGTFSLLGLNRFKNSSNDTSMSQQQELRNKISLPTDSPRFDAMGDTARRNRMRDGKDTTSPAMDSFGAFGGHRRNASVGSAGAGAATSNGIEGSPENLTGLGNSGAVMNRIRPVDREGWMRKRGERYNTWKSRYMALKGSDLVLLRDPLAPKIKGYINMRGYKVIADENTFPGKFGFKILHETEKPHYFSSDDPVVIREWMKALMKSTIGRDTSLPVISSYNNATISLKEAQLMNPPPRPPSPTSRARMQRAAARQNKDQITGKDPSVLMGLQQPQQQQSDMLPRGRSSGDPQQDSRADPLPRDREDPRSKNRDGLESRQNSIDSLKSSHKEEHDSVYEAEQSTYNVQVETDIRKMVEAPFLPERDVSEHTASKKTGGKPIAPLQLTEQRMPSNLPILDQATESEWSSPKSSIRSGHASASRPAIAGANLAGSAPSTGSILRQYLHSDPKIHNASPAPTPPPKHSAPLIRFDETNSPGQSPTLGLADLPPPPPPSHSPTHYVRAGTLAGALQTKRTEKPPRQPLNRPVASQNPFGASAPVEVKGFYTLQTKSLLPFGESGPTPISKDSGRNPPPPGLASSVGSYPTMTPTTGNVGSAAIASAPLGNERSSRFVRMMQKTSRPQSADDSKNERPRLLSESARSSGAGPPVSSRKWFSKGHRPGSANAGSESHEKKDKQWSKPLHSHTSDLVTSARTDSDSLQGLESARIIKFPEKSFSPFEKDPIQGRQSNSQIYTSKSSPRSPETMWREREQTLIQLSSRARSKTLTDHSEEKDRDKEYASDTGINSISIISQKARRRSWLFSIDPEKANAKLSGDKENHGLRSKFSPHSATFQECNWKPWRKEKNRPESSGGSKAQKVEALTAMDSSADTNTLKLPLDWNSTQSPKSRDGPSPSSNRTNDTEGQEMLESSTNEHSPMGAFDNLARHVRGAQRLGSSGAPLSQSRRESSESMLMSPLLYSSSRSHSPAIPPENVAPPARTSSTPPEIGIKSAGSSLSNHVYGIHPLARSSSRSLSRYA